MAADGSARALRQGRRRTKASPRNLTAGELRRRKGEGSGVNDEGQKRAFIGFDERHGITRDRQEGGQNKGKKRGGVRCLTEASWNLTYGEMRRGTKMQRVARCDRIAKKYDEDEDRKDAYRRIYMYNILYIHTHREVYTSIENRREPLSFR